MQNYGFPYYQYQPQAYSPAAVQAQQQTGSQNLIWVQGEAGAKSYLVAPRQSVLLMDSEDSVFYIKSADASGMPMPLRIFDYKERNPQIQQMPEAVDMSGYITREEFEAYKQSLKKTRGKESHDESAV